MVKVETVAQWFVNRAIFDVDNGHGDEYMTPLKVQKLLYYAQGCYGVMFKSEKLFPDKILKWTHGPVVECIYHKYKNLSGGQITKYESVELDAEVMGVLEEVYSVFGKYSAWALRGMTHEEDPWKNATQNAEITFDSIIEYFKGNIVS